MQFPAEPSAGDSTNPNKGTVISFIGWASDGASMVVSKRRSDGTQPEELWRIPVAGGAPTKLNLDLGSTILWGDGGLAIHPDGKRVAYTVTETTSSHVSEVWALENFLPKAAGR